MSRDLPLEMESIRDGFSLASSKVSAWGVANFFATAYDPSVPVFFCDMRDDVNLVLVSDTRSESGR